MTDYIEVTVDRGPWWRRILTRQWWQGDRARRIVVHLYPMGPTIVPGVSWMIGQSATIDVLDEHPNLAARTPAPSEN